MSIRPCGVSLKQNNEVEKKKFYIYNKATTLGFESVESGSLGPSAVGPRSPYQGKQDER